MRVQISKQSFKCSFRIKLIWQIIDRLKQFLPECNVAGMVCTLLFLLQLVPTVLFGQLQNKTICVFLLKSVPLPNVNKKALIRAYLMSRTLLSTISNIKRGLIGQVYQGCQRHQPKTSRDFLGTNYRQLETFIMTPSIFMVMKKEMNLLVAFKLRAFYLL